MKRFSGISILKIRMSSFMNQQVTVSTYNYNPNLYLFIKYSRVRRTVHVYGRSMTNWCTPLQRVFIPARTKLSLGLVSPEQTSLKSFENVRQTPSGCCLCSTPINFNYNRIPSTCIFTICTTQHSVSPTLPLNSRFNSFTTKRTKTHLCLSY